MHKLKTKVIDKNILDKNEIYDWNEIINNESNECINNNKSINNKSINNKSINNKSINNKSINNKSINNTINIYKNTIDNNAINKNIINKNTIESNIIDKNTIESNIIDKNTIDNNSINKNTINKSLTNDIIKSNKYKSSIFDKLSILNKSNNIINTIDENELETKLDINNINKNCKLCINCNSSLTINYNQTVCNNCGFENSYDISFDNDNTFMDSSYSNNDFVNFKITGKNSYSLQKTTLKICSNYDQYRKLTIIREINLWNNHSSEFKIPKHIMREAIEMFCKIKKADYVFRKDNKKGVLSACLYYSCYNNGIIKTPQEMSKYVGIQEKFHSYGDRVLQDLNDKGIISIPNKMDSINKYIDKYFELLEIDKIYKPFIINIINKLEELNIHLLHDSKNNTKCIGAIYLLTQRIPKLKQNITKEKIEKECKISKTTFIRYFKIINAYYKVVKVIFKRHAIPMPIEWKK